MAESRVRAPFVKCVGILTVVWAAAAASAMRAAPWTLTIIGEPAVESAAGVAVQPMVAPNAPRGLAAQAVGKDTVILVWRDASNNETGFVVQARLSGDPTFTTLGTAGANSTAISIAGFVPNTEYVFRVLSTNAGGTSGSAGSATVTTLSSDACVESSTAMCLNGDRFRVQALYLTGNAGNGDPTQSGESHTVALTPESGYLWFFNAANVEAVVKVINGCALNSRYWVFAGGLTDVEVILTVTDTALGNRNFHTNRLGAPFLAVQDTGALVCGD